MEKRILVAATLSALLFVGCGLNSEKTASDSMVPPTAGGFPLSPLQVPVYPPLGYNSNPSVLAGPPLQVPRVVAVPTAPVQTSQVLPQDPVVSPRYDPSPRFDSGDYDRFRDVRKGAQDDHSTIPNSPMLTPNNTIELSAVGMGVAPESTISPSQALALAKRAAIVDAYRQLGEKMYGIRLNAQDTVRDMVLQNSTVKTRVQALIRSAEITETVYKDGLCQVSMELKLDGRVWHRALVARG